MTDDTDKTPETEQAQQAEELSAYEKLVQQVKANMERLTSTIDAESLRGYIDKATHELKEIGDHSMEAITKAPACGPRITETRTDQSKISLVPSSTKKTGPIHENAALSMMRLVSA